MNYYNEFDPKAAAWLRELIKAGEIPPGDVDERSITEIDPHELKPKGYTQHHFFAGIGGWAFALQLADWPADRPVCTGSCPCQPFSDAGLGLGVDDPRHLWPAWFRILRVLGPAVVFGEQVASKAALGWLDGVFADLEGEGYACGASDLCAAGIGAPQIRQRLYWVANASPSGRGALFGAERKDGRPVVEPDGHRDTIGMADPDATGRSEQRREELPADADAPRGHDTDGRGQSGGLEHSFQSRLEGYGWHGNAKKRWEDTVRSIASSSLWPAGQGIHQHEWEEPRLESSLGFTINGYNFTEDLLRMAGNAVVEQQAELAFRTLIQKFL